MDFVLPLQNFIISLQSKNHGDTLTSGMPLVRCFRPTSILISLQLCKLILLTVERHDKPAHDEDDEDGGAIDDQFANANVVLAWC